MYVAPIISGRISQFPTFKCIPHATSIGDGALFSHMSDVYCAKHMVLRVPLRKTSVPLRLIS